ncbi:MAG: hypothetical protein U5R49_02015 [Deltaproteobacteria bacterium]|nr:hypothetical protein [Deltaproteobacteria bacterium]
MKSKSVLFRDSFPETASGNILSGMFYKISMGISNTLLLSTNGKGRYQGYHDFKKRNFFSRWKCSLMPKNFTQRIQLMNKAHSAPPSSTISGLFLSAKVLGATRTKIFPALIFLITAETTESLPN